jgi:hypothetical protein
MRVQRAFSVVQRFPRRLEAKINRLALRRSNRPHFLLDMLAYVFWHRRKEEVPKSEYQEKIIEYQKSLNESKLPGFEGSLAFKIDGASWFSKNSEGYEDWYLVDGSEVLDRLNDFAVINGRKSPHDDLAHLAMDFRGGLYQLRVGSRPSISAKLATWFSKPAGTAYAKFYDDMKMYMSADDRTLWRRQMTLGPTPEFCMIGNEVALPAIYGPISIQREIVWQSPFSKKA